MKVSSKKKNIMSTISGPYCSGEDEDVNKKSSLDISVGTVCKDVYCTVRVLL